MLENATSKAIYNIVDEDNKPFPVYCDFGSESGAAWTLIQSCSLRNFLDHFQRRPFYAYNMPINILIHLGGRATVSHYPVCSRYGTHPLIGVQLLIFQQMEWTTEITGEFHCKTWIWLWIIKKGITAFFSEHVNVRGNECTNCTVWCIYSSTLDLHMDSWGGTGGCSFNGRPGGIRYEDNFGYYTSRNHNFRCTSSINSTTQFWLGSF